ncbi:PAS domain S-box protein [Geofilum sp. OHC36d9]|uniref:PAS domain S-box protein n=1 Tax=Geofilum sp. OHC36d9 TaxID=3458413 RepID=UPI0040334CBE
MENKRELGFLQKSQKIVAGIKKRVLNVFPKNRSQRFIEPDLLRVSGLLNEMGVGIFYLSEFEIVKYNAVGESFLGMARDSSDLLDFWDLPWRYFDENNKRIRQDKHPVWLSREDEINMEQTLRMVNVNDQSVRWVRFYCVRGLNIDKPALGYDMMVVMKDVSPQMGKMEELDSSLQLNRIAVDISNRLLSFSIDGLDDSFSYALGQLGRFTQVDYCSLFRYNADEASFSSIHEWYAEGVKSLMQERQMAPFSVSPEWVRKINIGDVIFDTSISATANSLPKESGGQSAQSRLIIPVSKGDKVVGFLSFNTLEQVKVWSDSQIGILKLVAVAFGSAFRHFNAYSSLRKKEEVQRSILESTNAVVVILDGDGIYHYGNNVAYEQLGLSAGELTGKSIYEMLPEESAYNIMMNIRQVIVAGRATSFDWQMVLLEQKRWYHARVQPLLGDERNISKVLIYANDIHEQKMDELRLVQTVNHVKGIHAMGRLILERFNNSDELFRGVILELNRIISSRYVLLFEIDPVKRLNVCKLFVSDGVVKQNYPSFSFNDGDLISILNDEIVIRELRPDDLKNEAEKYAFERGIRSALMVPVKQTDLPDLTITLLSEKDHYFTNDHKRVVADVAQLIQIAVRQKEMSDRLSRYNNDLEQEVARHTREKDELAQLYRAVIEASGVMVITMNQDGLITSFNPKAEELLGYNMAEVVGKYHITDLHQPDALKRALDEAQMIAGKQFSNEFEALVYLGDAKSKNDIEYAYRSKDGRVIPVMMTVGYLPGPGKAFYFAIAMDLTGHKEAEYEQKAQLTAFNTFFYPMVLTDMKGDIVWANRQYMDLSGYSFNEMKGHKVGELQGSGEQTPAFYEEMWNTLRQGEVWRGELINKRKDGTRYFEELTISPVKDDDGTIHNFLAIKVDISEKKNLIESLAKSNRLFNALVDSLQWGLWLEDSSHNVLVFNKRVLELFNLDVSNKNLNDDTIKTVREEISAQLVNPDGYKSRIERLYTKDVEAYNDVLQFVDGRIYERDFIPVRMNDKVIAYLWQFRDITQRRRDDMLGLIHRQFGLNAAALLDLDEVIMLFLNTMRKLDDVTGGAFYLPDPEQPDTFTMRQSLGLTSDFMSQIRDLRSLNYNDDFLKSGEIIYRKYKPGEQTGVLLGTPFHKSAAHPVIHNGVCRGVVILFSIEPIEWTHSRHTGVSAMVAHLGAVLTRVLHDSNKL